MCDSVLTRLQIDDKVTGHLATRSRRVAGVSEKEKLMEPALIVKAASAAARSDLGGNPSLRD
jgi:hypothetical protein